MTTLTEKLATLPPDLVREVDDFVDFLLTKHHPVVADIALAEIGMDEYVHTLEQYETMLAEGKVQ
jgi:CO dehydrogenase/acetyl-CoA synthase beta subunit